MVPVQPSPSWTAPDLAIEEELDAGLPRAYTPDIFKAKASAIFQHVHEHAGQAA